MGFIVNADRLDIMIAMAKEIGIEVGLEAFLMRGVVPIGCSASTSAALSGSIRGYWRTEPTTGVAVDLRPRSRGQSGARRYLHAARNLPQGCAPAIRSIAENR